MFNRLIVFLTVLAAIAVPWAVAETSNVTLLSARTSTGGCSAVDARQFNARRIYHANGSTASGAGAAAIEIRGGVSSSNVTTVLGTITLTLSTDATAAAGNSGFASDAPWPYVCAAVTSISGTGAAVNSTAGVN